MIFTKTGYVDELDELILHAYSLLLQSELGSVCRLFLKCGSDFPEVDGFSQVLLQASRWRCRWRFNRLMQALPSSKSQIKRFSIKIHLWLLIASPGSISKPIYHEESFDDGIEF